MLVYIKPKSVFPELHSDTLFGAIVNAINDLFPEKVNEMILDFTSNNPPFILSSTFPFIDCDGKKIRFFPKFHSNDRIEMVKDTDVFKKFKKIDYLQEEIFFKILRKELNLTDILSNYDDYFSVGNLLLSEEIEVKNPYKNIIVPNNKVNRINRSTDIFYSEGMNFSENNGVFCFIEIFDEDYVNVIESAFRLLKDRGFGKDVSNGKGHFDYETEKINLNDLINIENSNRFITLSRFIPSENELDHINVDSYYELGFKRSISRSFDIRKQVRFFKEGSSFKGNDNFYGRVVPSGENAVEYGYAFPVKYYEGE